MLEKRFCDVREQKENIVYICLFAEEFLSPGCWLMYQTTERRAQRLSPPRRTRGPEDHAECPRLLCTAAPSYILRLENFIFLGERHLKSDSLPGQHNIKIVPSVALAVSRLGGGKRTPPLSVHHWRADHHYVIKVDCQRGAALRRD